MKYGITEHEEVIEMENRKVKKIKKKNGAATERKFDKQLIKVSAFTSAKINSEGPAECSDNRNPLPRIFGASDNSKTVSNISTTSVSDTDQADKDVLSKNTPANFKSIFEAAPSSAQYFSNHESDSASEMEWKAGGGEPKHQEVLETSKVQENNGENMDESVLILESSDIRSKEASTSRKQSADDSITVVHEVLVISDADDELSRRDSKECVVTRTVKGAGSCFAQPSSSGMEVICVTPPRLYPIAVDSGFQCQSKYAEMQNQPIGMTDKRNAKREIHVSQQNLLAHPGKRRRKNLSVTVQNPETIACPRKRRRKNLSVTVRNPETIDMTDTDLFITSERLLPKTVDIVNVPGQNRPSSFPNTAEICKPLSQNKENSLWPTGNLSQHSAPMAKNRRLRPVIIDGSNVAHTHGMKNRKFSCKGIELCVKYFQDRGHEVTVFVPQYRRCKSREVVDQNILERLGHRQIVVFTPSRKVDGMWINSYDDRFILDLAARTGGVIVSNDNYRDIKNEKPEWREAVNERLLMYLFVGDHFMVPDDPLGCRGVGLDSFLSF